MDDIDRTFETLKKSEFEIVKKRLVDANPAPFIINTTTYRIHVLKVFHHIVMGNGWIVEEFENKLNHDK